MHPDQKIFGTLLQYLLASQQNSHKEKEKHKDKLNKLTILKNINEEENEMNGKKRRKSNNPKRSRMKNKRKKIISTTQILK